MQWEELVDMMIDICDVAKNSWLHIGVSKLNDDTFRFAIDNEKNVTLMCVDVIVESDCADYGYYGNCPYEKKEMREECRRCKNISYRLL